jgi:hypothetical protein
MTYYWKLVIMCALPLPLLGLMLDWMALALSAPLAVLAAGWTGVRLAPKVPELRTLSVSGLRCPLAVLITVASGLLLGVAGLLHWGLLWSLGLFGVLVLPLAAHAHDIAQHEGSLFHLGFAD